jgi:hypothetical protein
MEAYLNINTNLNCEKRRRVAQRYEDLLYNEIFGVEEGPVTLLARPNSRSTPVTTVDVAMAKTPQFNTSIPDDFSNFSFDEPDNTDEPDNHYDESI